jgi:hypothetical protein
MARAAVVSLLLTGLCACGPAAQQDAYIAAGAAAPVSATRAAAPSTFAADDAIAIASARDQAVRAAREQTLRVQRQLVEQRRATHDAAQRGDGNARCIAGQKMRRVANGWVQAGGC